GSGVAVDDNGNVALTGVFSGATSLVGNWPPTPKAAQANSFVALIDKNDALPGARLIGDDVVQGNQTATGIAINNDTVAVAAYYTKSIGVSSPPNPPPPVTT